MTEPIETSIEPITAWRFWNLVRDPSGGLRLGPAGIGHGDWPPREAFRARCKADTGGPSPERSGRHMSPVLSCSCGIYAMGSLEGLMRPGELPAVSVIGSVSLWGRVIEHEVGWRAQFAYPQRLRIACVGCLHQGGGRTDAVTAVHDIGIRDGLVGLCAVHRRALRGLDLVEEDGARVQAELLDTYAVDLLPLETLSSVVEQRRVTGDTLWKQHVNRLVPVAPPVQPVRRGAPAPAPGVPPKQSLPRRIGRVIGTVLFWSLATLCYCRSSIVTVRAPAPTGAPVVQPSTPDPFVARRHPMLSRPEPEVARFEIVCGRLADGGERIAIVPCFPEVTPLMGSARTPPSKCSPMDSAVTRTDDYSICWFALDPDLHLPHRQMPAPNPFTHEEADDRVR